MFSTVLPQGSYFNSVWTVPGTDWTITGHSRALERTGFWIPELRVLLDAGVDLPTNAGGARPAAIFVTHGHIDHMNALPVLLRHMNDGDERVHVCCPAQIQYRLRQFAQLSWAVKVDDGEDLPEDYSPPPVEERNLASHDTVFEDKRRKWHALVPGSSRLLRVGKKGKTELSVRALKLFHGRCTSIGYLLSMPATQKLKLRPELVGNDKKETAANVQQAKARGEEINERVTVPEKPKLAFVLDTTIDALGAASPTASIILDCPVIMIECTYLEAEKRVEAESRGHICWCDLLPYVKDKHGAIDPKTWVLVHFSLRYSDGDIVGFFECPENSGIVLRRHRSDRPPDVVLWLDTGPRELWIESFL